MVLKGLFLQLRKPEIGDVPILAEWFQDPEFRQNLFEVQDEKYEKKAFDLLNQNAKDSTQTLALIAENTGREPIGLILYQNLNWRNRNVEMNNAIGHPDHRQHLYGPDLYLLGLAYAFTTLNLHKVFGYTYHTNASAKKLNNFAAKTSGVLPKHILQNGNYIDLVVFSVLKSEFVSFLRENRQGKIEKFLKTGIFEELMA